MAKKKHSALCGAGNRYMYDINVLILRDSIGKEQNSLYSQTNGMSDTGQR